MWGQSEMSFLRLFVIGAGLILSWQILVFLTAAPPYILPGPTRVVTALIAKWGGVVASCLDYHY